jgi:hypothetical protein
MKMWTWQVMIECGAIMWIAQDGDGAVQMG